MLTANVNRVLCRELLVSWLLVFILRLLMGIKPTISPPEGHIRRAKLWNYSADALP
jgi:hypothetical protein